MCRFVLYNSKAVSDVSQILADFAQMCKESKNLQKDGWGVMYREGNQLILQKSLNPIWEDAGRVSLPETDFLLVHARWAHGAWTKDQLENNQPFYKDGYIFAFNGNMKRVKLKMPGKIGAEKILNLILREIKKSGEAEAGISSAVQMMKDNAELIKAINFLLLKNRTCFIHSYYTIDPEYFDLQLWEDSDAWMISSYPVGERKFRALPADQVLTREMYMDVSDYMITEKPLF